MYLKNLTVLGFKSFADKTALNFQPGVTAIVGPNGCGKSNVSDAIRWVLGEQSAKALRGGEMADVIFNGTDARKPLGMAEVSLTIGGVDEAHLQTSGVTLSYDEVTITRRVFRDGASEYFINKTPCRLKDIQQLFMGTGVGRTSYSIMAQGNITQILSSKPEDRRMIFEEAAGITKYKAQKKEALRKLEYTEQNLVRVEDLVREVKRQIGSLQRQAGKARRYKQLSQELQHLETQLARHQFDLLQAEIKEREKQAENLRTQIETSSANVLKSEDEIGELRDRLSHLEQAIAGKQQQGLELKSEIDRHQSRIHFNEERLRELGAQNAQALADINQAEERQAIARQEEQAVKQNLLSAEAALADHRHTLEGRLAALRQLEQELLRLQEALRQAQAEAFGAAQDLSRARNELTALDLQKQGNIVRLEKLAAEKVQLEEERTHLGTRLQEFAANVETEKLNAQTQRGTVQQRQNRLTQIQQELNQATQGQEVLLQQQAEQRSRLNVLDQLQAGHEGFSEGSLAALKQSRLVLGSLADRIRVPGDFVMAIETALGHNLQLVLTEQPESAHEILAELSTNKRGRASVAPLAFMRNGFGNGRNGHQPLESASTNQGPRAVPELNGVPLAAVSVIESDETVRPVLERLLGSTRIVRTLDAATAAWRESHGSFDYVTLTGELLSQQGIYTGGCANRNGNARAASILARKNQIAELQSTLGTLEQRVAELSRRKGGLQAEQTELQAGLQQAQTELRSQEVAIATHEGEWNARQNSHRMLQQKIETVVYEVQSLAAQEQESLARRAELAARVTDLTASEQARQERVAELSAALESLRQQRDSATSQLTESKVALATAEQMSASFRQQAQSLAQRLRELTQLIEQRKGETGSCITRKQQAEAEIQESSGQMATLQHQRELVNTQAAQLLGQKQDQESEISLREEALREQRRSLTELQEKRGALDVELVQKNMSVQNLRERIQQKYHVNLDDVRSECITITLADEGPARIHVMSPEEMAASGAATDWAEVARQIETLQQRLDEMGPVNLVAIEEYEETEQRYHFLSKQLEDLIQAKTQLLEVINRINTQTREMFRTTFEQVRANFRTLFAEVFGGGKADLLLMDENDLLESGIDIVARPPGKQLQTISLLSGGEQTMTAVALLFSIYQVKPSPFCVLDELDAPLDESNINRFVRVLQRFLENSQFIIITHNKRTIGMADVLYGVTMQEHGVSKIVSVKFHKAGDPAAGQRVVSIETPLATPPLDQEEDAPHSRDETIEVMAK
jgi:chromosome segregation protein